MSKTMLRVCFGNNYDFSKPADLKKLLDLFITKKWIDFHHDQDLGRLPNNKKIYGGFSISPFRIDIDKSLEKWSSKFCFTLAHEIGHFVLHRTLMGKGKTIGRERLPVDTAEQLRYRDMAGMSDLEWVEWEANEFALSLIMPIQSLRSNVVRMQKEMGVLRNEGLIYLDHQACNQVDFGIQLHHLSRIYSVPSILIRRRLRFLNILVEKKRLKKFSSMNDLSNSCLNDLIQIIKQPVAR